MPDGKTVLTAVEGDVPEHAAIMADPNVISYLPIETDDGVPLSRNDEVRDIPTGKRSVLARMMKGRGIPIENLIGPTSKIADVHDIILRKIELEHILLNSDFTEVRKQYRIVLRKLRLAGFDVSALAITDTDDETMEKLLGQSRGRGRR